MDKRITEISEIAASGLRSDPEMYLAVKREMEDHVASVAEHEEALGAAPDAAVEKALAKFGPPAEVADSVLAVNLKRLKLRSRLRILFLWLLPIIAITASLAVLTDLYENWMYHRTLYTFMSFDRMMDKFAEKAGIDINKLPERQRWLALKNWDDFHKAEPEDPVWLARSMISTIKIGSFSTNSLNHYEMYAPDFLKKAGKLDPDNALYDYFAAAELLRQGSGYDNKSRELRINNRLLLMKALPFYLQGLKQKRYCNYREQVKKRRMTLQVVNRKYAEGWNRNLGANYSSESKMFEYFAQALPLWADELIKAGRKKQALQLLESWKILIKQILYSDMGDTVKSRNIRWFCYDINRIIPVYYRKLNIPEKAKETEKLIESLLGKFTKRFNGKKDKITFRDKVRKDFSQYAAWYNTDLGFFLMPDEYELYDLKPGRLQEYTFADRICLSVISALLLVLLLRNIVCYFTMRIILRKTLAPCLFSINPAELIKLILYGLFLPLIIWYSLRYVPYIGREYSLGYNSMNYLMQALFLVFGTIMWPIALMHYFIYQRLSGMGLLRRKYPFFFYCSVPLLLALMVLLLSVTPWSFWFHINFLDSLVQTTYVPSGMGFIKGAFKVELIWLLSALAGLCLILVLDQVVMSLASRRDQKSMFSIGAFASSGIAGSSCLVIFMLVMSGCFLRMSESYYESRNEFGKREFAEYKLLIDINKLHYRHAEMIMNNISNKLVYPDIKESTVQEIIWQLKNNTKGSRRECLALLAKSGKGTVEELKHLLSSGADINIRGKNKMTPLMIAARNNPDPAVVELLVRSGARLEDGDVFDATALMFAIKNPNHKVFMKLLELGANPNAVDRFGQSVFMCAAQNFSLDDLEILIKHGAKTTYPCRSRTALMYAVYNKDLRIIPFLLKHGEKINAVLFEAKKQNALIYACYHKAAPEVIELLLDYGANAEHKDWDGHNALYYAEKNKKMAGTKALERLRKAVKGGSR